MKASIAAWLLTRIIRDLAGSLKRTSTDPRVTALEQAVEILDAL